MSRKNLKFFLENLDYQDSDATNKFNGFSPKYSSISVFSQTELMMKEFELVVAEDFKFENGVEEKYHFLETSESQDTDARIAMLQFSHQKSLYN